MSDAQPPTGVLSHLGPIVAPGLRVLFVGINPSLYSAQAGHQIGRPATTVTDTPSKSWS